MPLSIQHIQFLNFRNYDSFDLDDIGSITIFIGQNGIGKTNIIEGIQLLTSLSSFRHGTFDELIKEGEEQGFLKAWVSDEKRDLTIALTLQDRRKNYVLNGKRKSSAEMKTILPAVIFTPDDLMLVKGPQTNRRIALDALGSQISEPYKAVKHDFETILRQKNALLKQDDPEPMLESINDVFLTCAAQLTLYRIYLFAKLAPAIEHHYTMISQSKEQPSLSYIPSWIEDDAFLPIETICDLSKADIRKHLETAIALRADEERARKRAVVGPNADKIHFYLDGRNATSYASQGQQRSLVLAWKLAEIDLIRDTLGLQPILLLDDVMSELDETRRQALSGCIEASSQVFITTTNLGYFDEGFLARSRCVKLPR